MSFDMPRENAPPEITVVVVSYNTRDMTLACLESLSDQTRTPMRVIVVDNASSDGSADAIARTFPGVELIESGDNLGFARANNLAVERAETDLLLLLNPDTVVLNGAVDELVRFARQNPDARIWGGRTRFADGSLNPASCWSRQTPWSVTCKALGLSRAFPGSGVLNPEAMGGWKREGVRRVDIVSGCFFLIERALWRRLGGFDPIFYMYGEEADLCLRARVLGARPMVTPDAEIVHHGGASERQRADKMVRLLAAKITLIKRHWSPLWAWYGIGVLCAFARGRALGDSAKRASERVWRSVWRRRDEWRRGYARAGA